MTQGATRHRCGNGGRVETSVNVDRDDTQEIGFMRDGRTIGIHRFTSEISRDSGGTTN